MLFFNRNKEQQLLTTNGKNKNNNAIVQLHDVVKAFPVGDSEITILHGISLDIHQGEFVSIVGSSGNGKSTLLNMITASARPITQAEKEVTDARLTVFGQNPETDFYAPIIEEGRWLLPTDRNAAVVSQLISGQQGWQLGDEITLENGNGRSLNVEIVGIHFDPATSGFDIILNLLAVMAVVIALVGGVGLSGILSLSVLERRREIGVMRAIGASSWQVTRLFIGEGILLGLISWLIALPLSIPIAYLFSTRALSFALNQQLVYQFTPAGAINWLIIITVLAIFASALPARGAARISVRESLAYS